MEAWSGRPSSAYESVSVVATTALEADVFSTAWFCADRQTIKNQQGSKMAIVIDRCGLMLDM
jgi:thiamine biosynthesis lipoprotein ApbE